MDNFNDLARHLRSIHLVFVLTAAAIVMALLGSNTIYDIALQQQRDVVRLADMLSAGTIASSVSGKTQPEEPASHWQRETKLQQFVEQSLLEYLEALDVTFDSAEFILSVKLQHDQYGYIDYEYEEYNLQNSWFENHLRLLTDGPTVYTGPRELMGELQRTIGGYRELINRLLGADRLYTSPGFHASYFYAESSSMKDRYPGLPDDVREWLSANKDLRLYVELTEVKLTNTRSRDVFDQSQAHAEDDPIAYESYDFEFDTFMLEGTAVSTTAERGSSEGESVEFELLLPVMFRVQQPAFVSDALQQAFDSRYYARYLSGARSFERIFPELTEVTMNLASITTDDLESYLEEQREASGAPISLLGLQISRELIEIWGVLLMLCVQLYFCMHYRTLLDRLPQDRDVFFPWIGLYRHPVAMTVFQVSIALPAAVTIFVSLRNGRADLAGIVAPAVAIALLIWTETIYVSFRRRLPVPVGKH